MSEKSTVAEVANKLKSVDEQRELFLWKYRDVSRKEVNEMLKVRISMIEYVMLAGLILAPPGRFP